MKGSGYSGFRLYFCIISIFYKDYWTLAITDKKTPKTGRPFVFFINIWENWLAAVAWELKTFFRLQGEGSILARMLVGKRSDVFWLNWCQYFL